MEPKGVLIVDEDGRWAIKLAAFFKNRDWLAFTAGSPQDGRKIFAEKNVELVFSSYQFRHSLPPLNNGVAFWEILVEIDEQKRGFFSRLAARLSLRKPIPKFEFVMMDEFAPGLTESIVHEKGIRWFLKKPVERDALEKLLQEISQERR